MTGQRQMKVVRLNSDTRNVGSRDSGQTQNWTSSARIARKTIRSLKDKPRPGPGLRAVSCRWTKGTRGWNWLRTKNHNSDFSTYIQVRLFRDETTWSKMAVGKRDETRRGFCVRGHGRARWLMMLSTYSVRRTEQSIDSPLPATVRFERYHRQIGEILYFLGHDSDHRNTHEDTFADMPFVWNWL